MVEWALFLLTHSHRRKEKKLSCKGQWRRVRWLRAVAGVAPSLPPSLPRQPKKKKPRSPFFFLVPPVFFLLLLPPVSRAYLTHTLPLPLSLPSANSMEMIHFSSSLLRRRCLNLPLGKTEYSLFTTTCSKLPEIGDSSSRSILFLIPSSWSSSAVSAVACFSRRKKRRKSGRPQTKDTSFLPLPFLFFLLRSFKKPPYIAVHELLDIEYRLR